jgi:hypothetical protein
VERIHSILCECKLLGVIGAIMAVVWTAGYSSDMDQRAHWLERMPAINQDHDLRASVDTADLDDIYQVD